MPGTTILRRVLQQFPRPKLRSGETARNFGKSLSLLGLALIAALYANTSARNGQLASAIFGAGLALTVSIWVAWRFVPRLASEVEWEWLPFLTELRPTREGWVALAAAITVGLTAINTNNNLLYMIFSALVATLILSVLLAGLNFRSLEVRVSLPRECFARKTFPMTLTLRNRKTVFPSLSLRIRPEAGSTFRFASSFFALLPARGSNSVTVQTAFNRRGRHTIGRVHLESGYPFGFFVRGGGYPVSGDCIAFPEIVEVKNSSRHALDLQGSRERFEPGEGMDLYRIRDYQNTDSVRRVDWKASARTSALKTREFAAEDSRRVTIVFDRYGRPSDELRFEELVSEAASMAASYAGEGIEAILVTDEWTSPSTSSEKGLESILRYLALVEMSSLSRVVRHIHGGESLLLSLR